MGANRKFLKCVFVKFVNGNVNHEELEEEAKRGKRKETTTTTTTAAMQN
jgi:hypothetical protein